MQAQPTTRARLAWVDATRGYCVAAVVLFHVVLWHFGDLGGVAPAARAVWPEVNSALGGARMPVLLAVSGLVLSRQIRNGLHRSTTVYRAASNFYLYVVWLGVYVGFYAVVGTSSLPHRVEGAEVAAELVAPDTTLWYILGLAVYIPILAAARRVPPWVVLLLLVGLTFTVWPLDLPDALWVNIPQYFIFFALGVYAAEPLRRLAELATAPRVALAGAVALGVALGGRQAEGDVVSSAVFLVRGVTYAVLVVLAVAIAVRWRPVRALGEVLGRRALAIYVLHPLLIAVVILVARPAVAGGAVDRLVATTPGALLYPLLLTAVVVFAAVGLQAAGERAGLGFLFEAPARMRAALGRPADAPAVPTLTPSAPGGARPSS